MILEEEIKSFPLSLSQKNIWNLERSAEGTSINNISTTIRIKGRVDFVLLQKSINLVLSADNSLRTRLTLQQDEPVQYFEPFCETPLEIYDFSHTSAQGISSWESATTREAIALLDAPLYRFFLFRAGENEGGVLIKIHHIISDGWSQVLLCNRIAETYLSLLCGREPALLNCPSYRLHVEEEQAYLKSAAYEKDRVYWQEVIQKSGEPSLLKSVKSAAISPVGSRISFRLPQVLNHAIYSFCQKNRVAPFAVFYMALAIYFKRIGGSERFTIGVPIVNRTNFQFKQSTGMFVNTLPFFNEIDDTWSFSQFNEHLMEAWYELLRHQRFPFEHITKLAAQRNGRRERLFHIAFSYQDSKIYESEDASVVFDGRWHYSGYQAEQLCIHLSNMENHRRYAVDYDYLTQLFSEQEIKSLHESLCNILEEALKYPDKPVHSLAVLTMEERERVLYTFNRTEKRWEDEALYSLLCRVAGENPNRAAVISGGKRKSYRELMEEGAALSACLQNIAAGPQALVAVLLQKSAALFSAMTGILGAGCAYLLISPEWPSGRIEAVLKKSGACALITDRGLQKRLVPEEIAIPVIYAEDNIEGVSRPRAFVPPTAGDSLAYVVYTSGSTGEPKGIEITQRGLLNFARGMQPVFGKGAVLSLCDIGFDAFQIESMVSLLLGRTVVLPDEGEEESPSALARLIKGYAVGFFSVTPSRLSAFLKNPEFFAAMRGVESVVCGGEAFQGELLKQLKACTNARVYNQYGPSETTIGVSMKELSEASLITAGKPMPNCKLYVLDEWKNPLPAGVYGTLYVGGACVGRGYRGAPELTEKSFVENPFETGERMYNTGDAACWTADGELLLSGRLDGQVKLRGLRLEPQEVAACLASHPAVKEAAARVHTFGEGQALIGYYCAEGGVNETELLTYMASYLPRYMLPSVLVRLEKLPLTASGKVDEAKLPAPRLTESAGGALPESDLERGILSLITRVLKKPELTPDSDYFLNGGDSLNAMQLLYELRELTGRNLRVADLYVCRTARRLARHLNGKNTDETRVETLKISPAPVLPRYPLTPVQQGIYVQSFFDQTGFAYHMAGAFLLGRNVDGKRLQAAFCRLIEDDALFRTSYVSEKDGVFAKVEKAPSFSLNTIEADSFEEACRQLLMPFSFENAPLLHAALWKDTAGECYLLIDIHHIIGDGMSTPALLSRLAAYYQGQSINKPDLSYHDYAYAQANQAGNGREDDRRFWKEHLSPMPPQLLLPTDFPRPHRFNYQGENYSFAFSKELSCACDKLCRELGVSVYTLLLAAFGVLLSKVSGKEDMLIGTPVSLREGPELQAVCGPFINTLPARIKPQAEMTVKDYLYSVHEEVTALLDHRRCSLEEMIEMLSLPRAASQNPLYSAAFSLRPFEAGELSFAGEPIKYRRVPTHTAKSELSVEAARENGVYELHFEYATSLFCEETIALYARSMEQIARQLVKGLDQSLRGLCALAPSDRLRLIEAPNHSFSPFLNLPIHQLIKHRAELTPDAPAVYFHGETVTLKTIEERACAIANGLLKAGAKPRENIGLMCSRTPLLFSAMLGILKAGCAYVPMLTSYPAGRVRSIAQTAQIKRILCDEASYTRMPQEVKELALLLQTEEETEFEDVPVTGEDIIHVLFTSGSTGKPKGVMICHRSIANLYESMRQLMEEPDTPILCASQSVFDIFITESLLPLCMGKPVVLADEEEMLLPWKMAELTEAYQIGFMQFTASRLQMCLGNAAFIKAARWLSFVIVGGEPVSQQLSERWAQVSRGRLFNLYGPTEATVYTTMQQLLPGEYVTIGRPMRNMRVYVLDKDGRPVMPTACGELYLAGVGVSKGYISCPDLTKAAFVPDLHFPGEMMYRSGDLGRLRADGSIDCLGRSDAQVKVNGVRVELEEIKSAMMGSGLCAQAAAVPLKKPDGSSEICAFFEQKAPGAGEEDMKRHLLKLLPPYMMPTRIYPLLKMPFTTTGKTDLQALIRLAQPQEEGAKNPSAGAASETPAAPLPAAPNVEEPERITPQALLAIWRETLGARELSPTESFFEQGGSSLAALNVLSRYYNEQLEMTLMQFYENPTAEAQARLLAGSRKSQEKKAEIQQRLQYPREVPVFTSMAAKDPETVFLTGATGYFGAHLLKALLEEGTRRVVCLVRGESERLFETLRWYFGSGWAAAASERIEVVTGEVTAEGLGLSKALYDRLISEVDAVYHSAADVRHYASDGGSYRTNTVGTQNIIEFSLACGAPLHAISTASIGGEFLLENPASPAVFTERDFDIGQNWRDNIYVESKFLAEAEIYKAMNQGLCAQVYRLGRLVGRAFDGVFQRNPQSNAFYLMLRAGIYLGAIPQSLASAPIDLTPVDVSAEAVVALRKAPQTAFHVFSPSPTPLSEVAFAISPEVAVLRDEQFSEKLSKTIREDNREILAPLVEFWNRARQNPARIEASCTATQQILNSLGRPWRQAPPQRLLCGFQGLHETEKKKMR